jgi:hypothetical protein
MLRFRCARPHARREEVDVQGRQRLGAAVEDASLQERRVRVRGRLYRRASCLDGEGDELL